MRQRVYLYTGDIVSGDLSLSKYEDAMKYKHHNSPETITHPERVHIDDHSYPKLVEQNGILYLLNLEYAGDDVSYNYANIGLWLVLRVLFLVGLIGMYRSASRYEDSA